jgi:hypothetical protein
VQELGELRTAFAAAPRLIRVGAAVLAVCLLAIGSLGAVNAVIEETPAFNLSGEVTETLAVAPLFSALVLAQASLTAAWLALLPSEGRRRVAWVILAVLFAFMSVDELGQIHEQIEDALGIEWQLFYLPVLGLGAIAWIVALSWMVLWPLERDLWLAGAAAWVAARIIDNVPWGESEQGAFDLDHFFSGVEEMLEAAGNCCFLLALLCVWMRAMAPGAWRSP